jgi:hypothetical protein
MPDGRVGISLNKHSGMYERFLYKHFVWEKFVPINKEQNIQSYKY